MPKPYHIIIIGGGHNGLVTAAYLAQAGHKVVLLEQRPILGGAAASEEIFPGFIFNTGASNAGLFRPEIVAELKLRSHGLQFLESPVAVFAPQPDGRALTLWQDPGLNQAEIRRFSAVDAQKFPAFMRQMTTFTGVLDNMMTLPPLHPGQTELNNLVPWTRLGLKLKGLGKQDMMEFLRVLPMSVNEFLDPWFESDALKGVLGAAGISGLLQGPQSAGTAFVMLYHYLGIGATSGFKASRFVRGGIGQLSASLAAAAKAAGAFIQTNAEVAAITVADNRATGVTLANGEQLFADLIISNADPRRTLFGLVGPHKIPPTLMRRVRNIRFKGVTAKLNLALRDLPQFSAVPSEADVRQYLAGHISISPSLEYLERAYDDAKYGTISQQPYLEVVIPSILDPSLAPAGQHVMSVTMQYAPYQLRDGNWPEQREALADHIINTLTAYAPNLRALILHQQIVTPLDWEQEYGLSEGDISHGQMGLDQLLFMRPIAGYGQYRTPLDGLYLCGAGTHPGGGVSGAPGYNAAREILKVLKNN